MQREMRGVDDRCETFVRRSAREALQLGETKEILQMPAEWGRDYVV